jgi:cation diffusion facilitator CzcD-associated flavoprotein CzcO
MNYANLCVKAIERRMAAALGNDPKLIKKMIPDFPMGCRRLGPAEGFLECFLEPNVTLAEGTIETFTEKGIKTSTGEEYEADIIIAATGFDVSFKPYFPIVGRDGKTLTKEWAEEANAYLALAAHGFPNFMSKFVRVIVDREAHGIFSWLSWTQLSCRPWFVRNCVGSCTKLHMHAHQKDANREH